MIVSARIEHALHARLVGEEIGDDSRGGAMPIDTQRKRLQALQQDPGVERAERRSGLLEVGVKLLIDEGLAAEHDAPETASLAIDVFGRGIANDVRAERERPLQ